jgi:hypothetical protein
MVLLTTIRSAPLGNIPGHRHSLICERLYVPNDKTGMAAKTPMETLAVSHLDSSVTCKMAAAAARDKAGCVAIWTEKSAPIVFGRIVGVG